MVRIGISCEWFAGFVLRSAACSIDSDVLLNWRAQVGLGLGLEPSRMVIGIYCRSRCEWLLASIVEAAANGS